MNNRENDDELERMRARARRGSGRQEGGRQSSRAYPRPVQPAGERRSARQSYDGREEYDEEYYYGEEYDAEEDRQIDFPMEDYLDDEPPMPARRLRSSYGSSGSAEGRRQAQSAGNRNAQGRKSRQPGSASLIRTGQNSTAFQEIRAHRKKAAGYYGKGQDICRTAAGTNGKTT